MAAGYYTTKVTIPSDTGLPKDAVTNTWAFERPDGVAEGTAVASWLDALQNFYIDCKDNLSSAYQWNSMTADTYDMADTEPRVPVNSSSLSVGTLTTSAYDLPAEVAVVLSFKAQPVSGDLSARKRGRVYIGPLQIVAGDNVDAGGIQAVIADSANTNILTSADNGTDFIWSVYSRSEHFGKDVGEPILPADVPNNANLPQAFSEVWQLWSDNAWDTQRRRGISATARTTHTAP